MSPERLEEIRGKIRSYKRDVAELLVEIDRLGEINQRLLDACLIAATSLDASGSVVAAMQAGDQVRERAERMIVTSTHEVLRKAIAAAETEQEPLTKTSVR